MRTAKLFAIVILAVVMSFSAFAADKFWAQATDVRGDVTFIKHGATQTITLKRGMVLQSGDTVITSKAARVSFLMSDGKLFVLRGEKKVVIDKSDKTKGPVLKSLAKNLSGTLLTREGDNPMLKHIAGLRGGQKNLALAPRRTRVRGNEVTLVWLPRAGVERYTVLLMNSEGEISEFTVRGTSTIIPADKVKNPGTYYWEVRDAGRPEEFNAIGSGRFEVMEAGELKTVDEMLDKIHRAFPESKSEMDSTPLFLKYQVFRENGLTLDALKTLNIMLESNPEDKQLTEWRDDLCDEMGISKKDLPALMADKY